jgi:hypothetical protein
MGQMFAYYFWWPFTPFFMAAFNVEQAPAHIGRPLFRRLGALFCPKRQHFSEKWRRGLGSNTRHAVAAGRAGRRGWFGRPKLE